MQFEERYEEIEALRGIAADPKASDLRVVA
jgi:hypothetical protein